MNNMKKQDNERKKWVTEVVEKSCWNLGFRVSGIKINGYRVIATIPLGSVNHTLILSYSEDSTAADIHDDIFASLSTKS